MQKRLVFFSLILIFCACTKAITEEPVKEKQVGQWLMANCQYRTVETSTEAIVFDAFSIKLDDATIAQRGIYYYKNTSLEDVHPSVKQLNASGYVRDIEIGAATSSCPNYRTQHTIVSLKIISGDRYFTWQNCPVTILEHETTPASAWNKDLPKTIEIRLSK